MEFSKLNEIYSITSLVKHHCRFDLSLKTEPS